MSEKSRQFKVATADLRDIIFKKSALQLRLNKHKDQYTSMLEDMHGINEKLDARQKEVSSALQLRLNKHKDQYTSMLEDMHGINEKLDARQKEVSSLQLELQSSVNDAPAPDALPDAAEALVKQVEAMDVDQLEAYRK
eukprot:s16538_g1.t1